MFITQMSEWFQLQLPPPPQPNLTPLMEKIYFYISFGSLTQVFSYFLLFLHWQKKSIFYMIFRFCCNVRSKLNSQELQITYVKVWTLGQNWRNHVKNNFLSHCIIMQWGWSGNKHLSLPIKFQNDLCIAMKGSPLNFQPSAKKFISWILLII